MPKVSIIIATYSRPDLLPRAVESAFRAGTDVEVIVVDDASTDETAAVCQNLQGIKYVRVDRNQHTAGARNIGILNSTAPYIGFLDDDDWRLPGVLDKQIQILEENPEVGLVYGRYFLGDQSGNIIGEPPFPEVCPQGDVFWRVLHQNPIGCLTAVFRKSCLSRVGLLDQTIPGIDDSDLWVRIAEFYPFAAVDEPVAVWRKPLSDSGQGSSNITKLYSQLVTVYKKKWSKLPRVLAADPEFVKEQREIFLNGISVAIQTEIAQTSSRVNQLEKAMKAVQCQPKNLTRLVFYRSMAKALLEGAYLIENRVSEVKKLEGLMR